MRTFFFYTLSRIWRVPSAKKIWRRGQIILMEEGQVVLAARDGLRVALSLLAVLHTCHYGLRHAAQSLTQTRGKSHMFRA
jgi:hypothetical protein